VARRQRYEEIRNQVFSKNLVSINDLITYNLDIQQFAQDVIENCEGPELLRAFWRAINQVTVLDPTCGSGAFLFAALNILEPLYEACLGRMEAFVAELAHGDHHPHKYKDFREVLDQMERHPNRSYFVLKSIVVNNLYGVDIMAEAVEIAKLRLFLKLVAQVDRVEDIEPLPDIDFNIRAGNTLVGFTTIAEVERAMKVAQGGQRKLMFGEDVATLQRIEEKAADVDRLFGKFQAMQTAHDMREYTQDFMETKEELRKRLQALEDELNRYLAQEYGVDVTKPAAYQKWLASHQPFHWFIEFYGILKQGGFDVIIGNPPYVEYGKVRKDYTVREYETEKCGNLYTLVIERSLSICGSGSWWGLIVQLSSISTRNMMPLHTFIRQSCNVLYVSCFAERPQQLFDGACIPLTIMIGHRSTPHNGPATILTTGVYRWHKSERPSLFQRISYCVHTEAVGNSLFYIPKLQSPLELVIFDRFSHHDPISKHRLPRRNGNNIYYRSAGGRYWKVILNFPFGSDSTANKSAALDHELPALAAVAILSSNLFWWYYIISFDLYNLKDYVLFDFRFTCDDIKPRVLSQLVTLGNQLMSDYRKNVNKRTVFIKSKQEYATYYEYLPRLSKPIIDEIDHVLAQHYGFTDDELDFILNYDIKYRMGDQLPEEEGEEE
jgi:cell fate (sporulation/competence/biofilm development) regulator YlbF (YheA/YmcA/DUF963 family)